MKLGDELPAICRDKDALTWLKCGNLLFRRSSFLDVFHDTIKIVIIGLSEQKEDFALRHDLVVDLRHTLAQDHWRDTAFTANCDDFHVAAQEFHQNAFTQND